MLLYNGQTVADQQLVDVVAILNKDNDELSIGIEIHTHLPINKRFTWRDADKYKVEDETIYGNYRKVQGIESPTRSPTSAMAKSSARVFLTHIEYNTTFEPGFFDAKVTYNPETYNPKDEEVSKAAPHATTPSLSKHRSQLRVAQIAKWSVICGTGSLKSRGIVIRKTRSVVKIPQPLFSEWL